MRAKLLSFLLIITTMTGCSTLLSQSDSCGSYSLEEIHTVIEEYETDGAVPESSWDIDDYYMARSYCYAHPVPPFDITRACVIESKLYGILFSPITVPIDIIRMPIGYRRTNKIADAEIQQALSDIRKARALSDKDYSRYPATFGPAYRILKDHDFAPSVADEK